VSAVRTTQVEELQSPLKTEPPGRACETPWGRCESEALIEIGECRAGAWYGFGTFTAADSTLPGSRLAARTAYRHEREATEHACDHGRGLRRMEHWRLDTSGRVSGSSRGREKTVTTGTAGTRRDLFTFARRVGPATPSGSESAGVTAVGSRGGPGPGGNPRQGRTKLRSPRRAASGCEADRHPGSGGTLRECLPCSSR
jgi:hypothetical protein